MRLRPLRLLSLTSRAALRVLYQSRSLSTHTRLGAMATAVTGIAHEVIVSLPTPPPGEEPSEIKERPAHHVNDSGTKFKNPWPSFRMPPVREFAKTGWHAVTTGNIIPKDIATQIPVQEPTWGADLPSNNVKATWLGHACYLIELPTPAGAARGPRILFDPVLLDRCAPTQWVGPKRFTPAPCSVDEIPPIDALVISHNHYDHTESSTLTALNKKYKCHVFMPLGNQPYMDSLCIPKTHSHTLDWWDNRLLTVTLPSKDDSNTVKAAFKLTCTPSQHVANRGLFDRWKSLWASWAIEEVSLDHDADAASGSTSKLLKKVYFTGDTGYRSIQQGEDENLAPVCPAFAEVGEKLGPFDLALIPIGAYAPRHVFSFVHVHPSESVRIFLDIKAKKALAMHWGTWVLTTEPVMEPPQVLKEECSKANIPEDDFDICGLGETRAF